MRRCVILTAFLSVAVMYAVFQSTPALADPELVVDDNGLDCPGAGFTSIQAAVNAAAPRARIRVCAGTYIEQVTINKPLTIIGDNGAVVMPSPMVANTSSLFSGAPLAAAILVDGTTNVTVKGLTVDGVGAGIFCGSPSVIGIFYRNGSGKIKDVAVRNIKSLPGGEGCQTWLGIFVQSGGGGTSTVEVEDSSVHDYQKNGITGNEPGTDIRVKGNIVTGIGPTTGAAQNGIQIGFGATGRIEENTVINHLWSPCVSVSICDFVATNILVAEADSVRIAENTVGKGQVGIYLVGNKGKVEGNNVFDTDVWDGIAVVGDNNKVEGNTITNSDEAAIFLEGNQNSIIGNKINEAPVGVLKVSGGVGNVIEGNHFVNTLTPILDPPPAPGGSPTPFR